jgi:alpha-mannosidase
LAEPTLGKLRGELCQPVPINLLLSGELARTMLDREPETHAAVLAALEQGKLGLIGGEYRERRLPLLSCESVLWELRRGLETSLDVFQRRTEVFGRRIFGLSPLLPGVLEKLRFRGALHATLDDGQFPSGYQVKTRWQGADAGVVDAIAKPPLDASQPATFLGLAQKLGESMDTDHVATLCLAHWPGAACPWYQDLRRCARYTPALGKFVTVESYFADTYLPGHVDRFEPDQYRSPYLRQDVIRRGEDPISSVVRYWRRRVAADRVEAVALLAQVIGRSADLPGGPDGPNAGAGEIARPTDLVEQGDPASPAGELDDRLAGELARWQTRLAASLGRENTAAGPGYLVVNPSSFTRRECVDVSRLSSAPNPESPVYRADEVDGRKLAVVDVPAMGFAWLSGGSPAARRGRDEPCLVEDARGSEGSIRLRNEFVEASFHPASGALQSFKDYQSRANRLSQQLALRLAARPNQPDAARDPGDPAHYTVMVADELSVVTNGAALGEVESRGRLLKPDGQPAAEFRQRWRLWRGSRVLYLDVELTPRQEPLADPWNSYYCCRFAWSDDSAELYHGANQLRRPLTKKRIDSPLYLELESGARRVTLLAGGLPYHRRVGDRMLDTLLIVRGERARSFRLGIGLDLAHALPEALALLAEPMAVYQSAPSPAPAHCWLFHVDARSVVATHWSPVWDSGKLVGVRTRLLEGAGKGVRARLASFRPFVSARQLNFVGETQSQLALDEGRAVLDLSAHEWIEVECRWEAPPRPSGEGVPAT